MSPTKSIRDQSGIPSTVFLDFENDDNESWTKSPSSPSCRSPSRGGSPRGTALTTSSTSSKRRMLRLGALSKQNLTKALSGIIMNRKGADSVSEMEESTNKLGNDQAMAVYMREEAMLERYYQRNTSITDLTY